MERGIFVTYEHLFWLTVTALGVMAIWVISLKRDEAKYRRYRRRDSPRGTGWDSPASHGYERSDRDSS